MCARHLAIFGYKRPEPEPRKNHIRSFHTSTNNQSTSLNLALANQPQADRQSFTNLPPILRRTQNLIVPKMATTNNNYQLVVILAPLLMLLFVDGMAAQPNRNQVENFANLAEKISDRQHTKYCEKFGQTFKEKSDVLWPKIHEQCIEKMVRDGTQLPANFPKIDADMRKKIIMIFEVCAPPVKNPCIPEEWATIKRCIRDESFNTKLLEVNGKQALPKNVPSISLGLASAVLDCTDKVVRAGPV